MTATTLRPYRGRFAPSPSGPLHFGSLITALASYIHAKQNQGTWLVRIEDIDPPREQAGASDDILKTLEAYGLHWDETVRYQSQQTEQYQAALAELAKQGLTYQCKCTRAQIKEFGGIYNGTCRKLALTPNQTATRLINQYGIDNYQDILQGHVQCDTALAQEDFTLVRKDGLFAYQLAVVLDDIDQRISHVIRGCDLLEPTARQLTFFKTLNQPAPMFGHIPLAVTEQGYKLSKQNKAPAIDKANPQFSLIAALKFLGQSPDENLVKADSQTIISWSVAEFDFEKVPKSREIMLKE